MRLREEGEGVRISEEIEEREKEIARRQIKAARAEAYRAVAWAMWLETPPVRETKEKE